jgi:hypothetical protein
MKNKKLCSPLSGLRILLFSNINLNKKLCSPLSGLRILLFSANLNKK